MLDLGRAPLGDYGGRIALEGEGDEVSVKEEVLEEVVRLCNLQWS